MVSCLVTTLECCADPLDRVLGARRSWHFQTEAFRNPFDDGLVQRDATGVDGHNQLARAVNVRYRLCSDTATLEQAK